MKLYDKIILFYKDISILQSIQETLNWDMNVKLPVKAIGNRSEQLSLISKYIHKLITNIHFANDIYEMIENGEFDTLTSIQKKEIIKLRRVVENQLRVPESLKQELIKTTTNAFGKWEDAMKTGDDKEYIKELKKIIELKIQYAKCKEYISNPYDALLDDYDEGLTYDYIKPIFSELKDSILNIINKNKDFKKCSKITLENYLQEKISYQILKMLKLDGENLDLSTSLHPFSTNLGINDFRITTNYKKDDITCSIYSVLHESGHAIYEMEVQNKFPNSPVSVLDSLSLHESQSRFFENIIGKNKNFIEYFLPEIKSVANGNLDNCSVENFYQLVNNFEWTPIRIDSSEIYYDLHIILRTEIEYSLINKEITPEDINEVWNRKFKDLFDHEVNDKREGYLQDVHWSGGDFGYFPTYTIGNIIASQLAEVIDKNTKLLSSKFTDSTISQIRNWLRDNVYKYGSSMTSKELVKKVTKKDIDPKSLINYLEKKYL